MNSINVSSPLKRFQVIKPLIEKLNKEIYSVSRQARRDGTIDLHYCEHCHKRNIIATEILNHMVKHVPAFVEWLTNREITNISATDLEVTIKATNTPIFGLKGRTSWPNSLKEVIIKKTMKPMSRVDIPEVKQFFSLVFSSIEPCEHIVSPKSLSESIPLLITKIKEQKEEVLERMRTKLQLVLEVEKEKPTSQILLFACMDCQRTLLQRGCDHSIRSQGVLYKNQCPIRQLIFETLMQEFGYDCSPIDTAPHDSIVQFYTEYMRGYFSRTLNTLFVQDNTPPDDIVEALEPELIIAFNSKKIILDLLPSKAKLVVVAELSEDSPQYYFFTPSTPVEKDIEKVISSITANLTTYSTQLTGKEHDRLIVAFKRIGEELGYIVDTEFRSGSSRVDVVWLDNEGKVSVAIEIETGGSWKKDILSTWELQPDLAIILSHYKTEKGIQSLLDYPPLVFLPHKLLFINNTLGSLYLLDKQILLATYKYKTTL